MSHRAMAHVRKLILSKELPEGTVLKPELIGRDLDISTTPAREALQVLASEGFLKSEVGVGFIVAELSANDIEDIFLIHAFLSGELTARAVDMATDDDINELEALHYELLAGARRGNLDIVENKNHEFHRLISNLSDSSKVANFLGLVARYVPRDFYREVEGWQEASAREHEAIVDAFRSRDRESAREAMAQHIKHAGQLLAADFDRR